MINAHYLLQEKSQHDRYHGLDLLSVKFPLKFSLPEPIMGDRESAAERASKAAPAPYNVELYLDKMQFNVNRQTLAALLDMVRASSAAISSSSSATSNAAATSPPTAQETVTETDVSELRKFKLIVKIDQLAVTLVKDDAGIADMDLGNVVARVDRLASYFWLQGRMGSLRVHDLTKAGTFYRQVFSTTGDNALVFSFLQNIDRSGSSSACRNTFRMQMASIQYVHTRRFMTMLSAYVSQFREMQMILHRVRAAAVGIMATVETKSDFLCFDISIDRPLISIPRNSFSPDVLLMDLGHMRINNELQVMHHPLSFP